MLHTQYYLAISLLVLSASVQAAGLLTPSNSALPALEIKTHDVEVIIEDGYAITTVEQVFHNPHAQDLEAIYSFPVPEHGSVAEFTLWIDGQPITGEVLEKKQAKQVYEEEKAAGRDAGLTEKDSYKTFDISVARVPAQQDTQIRLVYLQPAHVDTGIGRYVYPLEEGGVDEQKLAFWTAQEAVTEQFSFDLRVRSGYPVAALRLPNQPQAQITQHGEGDWQATITHGQAASIEEGANPQTSSNPVYTLDQDIVAYWRHQTGLPGSVDLIAHKTPDSERGTFMLVLTPGDDLQPITEGSDWVFVLDISGSMQGKYATLVQGVQRALQGLTAQDRFRIVLFNSMAREITRGFIPATAENISQYSQRLAGIQPNSGTNLYYGLELGLRGLDADRSSGIVLVTDGVANVGETRQRSFIDMIKNQDVRLFTFIMGNSANRPLLEAMTKASGGFAQSVSNSDDILGLLLNAASKLSHEALHGVALNISGVKTSDVTPENIGSLYRGQQLVMLGHYWGDGMATIELTGKRSGQPVRYTTEFAFPELAQANPELERLWAYARIEDMTLEMEDFGEQADLKQAVIDLGVAYGLVTDYTSMVVLTKEQFKVRGIDRHNDARRQIERQAQAQRLQNAPQSNRVDNTQPMYQNTQPNLAAPPKQSSTPRFRPSGGGGSFGPAIVLLLMLLIWVVYRRP